MAAPPADGKRLKRRRRVDDKLYINPAIIPEGISYEWKRESVYGKADTDHINNLRDNHWAPVPGDRHPGLVLAKDGLRLYERPKYLTDEAKQEDYEIAMGEMKTKERQLLSTPPGTMTRDHPSVRNNSYIKKTYGSMTAERD